MQKFAVLPQPGPHLHALGEPPARRPALRALLRIGHLGQAAANDAGALTDLASTAWAYVRQTDASPPIYYAQPDQAVLYQPDQAAGLGIAYNAKPVVRQAAEGMIDDLRDGDGHAVPADLCNQQPTGRQEVAL